ncbi:hypothetical protein GF373_09095 [bacterium]|nr:hypothetical protein [bacterium]
MKKGLFLSFLLIVAVLPPGFSEDEVEFSLWPGEEYTLNKFKISWDELTVEKHPNLSDKTVFGDLVFAHLPSGKKHVLRFPEKPDMRSQAIVYLEETLFEFSFESPERSRFFLQCKATKQSSQISYDASGFGYRSYAVSHLCPLRIGEWKFTIDKETQGGEDSVLVVENTETDELKKMVVADNNHRAFGRLHLYIIKKHMFEKTKTIVLHVKIEPDLSIRGGNTYVNQYEIGETEYYGTLLDQLQREFAFDVEIPLVKGAPGLMGMGESSDNLLISRQEADAIQDFLEQEHQLKNSRWTGILKKDLLPRMFPKLVFEWETPHKAYLRAADAYKQEVQRKEKIKEDLQFALKWYRKEIRLVMKIYPLDSLDVSTAKSLVEKELGNYVLEPAEDRQSGEWIGFVVEENSIKSDEWKNDLNERRERLQAELEGHEKRLDSKPSKQLRQKIENLKEEIRWVRWRLLEPHAYREAKDRMAQSIADEVVETRSYVMEDVVQDPQSNAIIVTAIPETHKRIEALLARMESMVKEPAQKAIPEKHTIEIILLYGQSEAGVGLETIEPNKYGLDSDNLHKFGVESIFEQGRSVVDLFAERGEVGEVTTKIGDHICTLEFLDTREPYLVVKVALAATDAADRPILENSVFLQKEQPGLLGITDLELSKILVLNLK